MRVNPDSSVAIQVIVVTPTLKLLFNGSKAVPLGYLAVIAVAPESQKSAAVGVPKATFVTIQLPESTFTETSAGAVIVGLSLLTCTSNLQHVLVKPPSVTDHSTVVDPALNVTPLSVSDPVAVVAPVNVYDIVAPTGIEISNSVPCTVYKQPTVFTVFTCLGKHPTDGVLSSLIVIIEEQVLTFPLLSVIVHSTVMGLAEANSCAPFNVLELLKSFTKV